MLELDMAQRRLLTANAHHLNPIVMIGKDGLTAGVISELDRGLTKHELIKVKILDDDRANRAALLEQICQSLHAAPVKLIGKILIIYRPKPEETEDTPAAQPAKPKGRSKKTTPARRRPA
ncbi:ribosome assembly RNA-binding protein YhbY [Nitrosomonas sp. ANs5]|uniref:ribosome assembly RNA-binding protein YhbY n=1 Tax=Nitrosomonas sp. ANs5 TaxID=3423941 RepID=UPI003D3577BA